MKVSTSNMTNLDYKMGAYRMFLPSRPVQRIVCMITGLRYQDDVGVSPLPMFQLSKVDSVVSRERRNVRVIVEYGCPRHLG